MKIRNHVSHIAIIIGMSACITLISCATKPLANQLEHSGASGFSLLSFTDIGANTLMGSNQFENQILTLIAGGADIWGTKDEFRFAYQKQKGDFDVVVQIKSLSNTHTYTKAGIMARADLSDNCAHAYFQIFPDNSPRNKNNGGCEFQYRLVKGGEMKAIYPDMETAATNFDVTFPETWIRLKRLGNNFESYFMNKNKTWELFSSFELELPGEVFLGLALTAHDSKTLAEAKFSSLEFK